MFNQTNLQKNQYMCDAFEDLDVNILPFINLINWNSLAGFTLLKRS